MSLFDAILIAWTVVFGVCAFWYYAGMSRAMAERRREILSEIEATQADIERLQNWMAR